MVRCLATDSFVSPAQRWQWHYDGILDGALVEHDRDADSYRCPWGCGATGEAVNHRHIFWDCPRLAASPIPEVQGSNSLTRRALAAIDAGSSAFWLRGTVPRPWTHDACEPPLEVFCAHGDASFAATAASVIATDGGGGAFSSDPRRRRCTFGYVILRLHLDKDGLAPPPADPRQRQRLAGGPGCWIRMPSSVPPHFDAEALKVLANFTSATARCASATVLRLVHGKHGGPAQTVPRAELTAIRVALQLEAPRAWTFLTDHENHVNAWNKGRAHVLESALQEIWADVLAAAERHPTVRLVHTHAHRDGTVARDVFIHGRKPLEYIANGFADAAAGIDAKEAEIQWGIAESISIVDGIAIKVLKRLTAMAMVISDKKRDPRPTRGSRQLRPDIAALCAASDHELVRQGAGYRCSLCATYLTRSQLRRGEGDGCFPVDVHFRNLQGRPAPPPAGSAAPAEIAARRGFHHSHWVGGFDGGLICWTCGAFSSSNRAVGLRRPCVRPTQAGVAARTRVAQGRAAKWVPRDSEEARAIARTAVVERACQLQQRHREEVKAAAALERPKRRRIAGKSPAAAVLQRWIDQGDDRSENRRNQEIGLSPDVAPGPSPGLIPRSSGKAGEKWLFAHDRHAAGEVDDGPVTGEDGDLLTMAELIEAYELAHADGARDADPFEQDDFGVIRGEE